MLLGPRVLELATVVSSSETVSVFMKTAMSSSIGMSFMIIFLLCKNYFYITIITQEDIKVNT